METLLQHAQGVVYIHELLHTKRDDILAIAARYGASNVLRAWLRGINGVELNILTVWIVANDTTQFVTLVPWDSDHGKRLTNRIKHF